MKTIKLKTLKVENFRNIEKGEYQLFDRTAISGKNYIGKSNLLDAISFLLTNRLLLDCNNLESIKPIKNKNAKVVVSGIFEKVDEDGEIECEREFKKVYYENWAKARNGDELELKGHTTELFVNNIRIPTQKAYLKDFYSFIEYEEPNFTSDIDVICSLVDQKYLTEELGQTNYWKKLRNVVIDIAGDVSNEDVFEAHSELVNCKDYLAKANGCIDDAIKYAKSEIKMAHEQVLKSQYLIEELEKVKDVDSVALSQANDQIEKAQLQISELENNGESQSMVADYDKQIADLKVKISEQKVQDLHNLGVRNQIVNEQIKALREDKEKLFKDKEKLIDDIQYKKNLLNVYSSNKQDCVTRIESYSKQIKSKRNEYKLELAKNYKAEEEQECPNCHFILNKVLIEASTKAFNERKKKALADIESSANDLKNAIADLQEKADSSENEMKKVISQIDELQKQKDDIDFQVKTKNIEITNLESKVEEYQPSDMAKGLQIKLAQLEEEKSQYILDVKNAKFDVEEKIAAIKENVKGLKEIVSAHDYYVRTQTNLNAKKDEHKQLLKVQTLKEEMVFMLLDFMKTKLAMLDERVYSAFGVRFQLYKNNIKAGSWDETCIPFIIGKETLYSSGSTSERIITNIAIIEAIKKAKELPNLPILFDAGGELDSFTIASRLNTSSQIICAKVNDYYSSPKFEELK